MKQENHRSSAWLLALCLMILCLLPPSASLAGGHTRYVLTENGKSLNVRDLPGKNGSVISRLANGSKVTVLSDEGEWILIELNGSTGYVMAQFLSDSKPTISAVSWTTVSKTMYVETGNKGKLHLRKDASKKSASKGLYANGTEVKVSALSDSWAKVSVSGQTGYMQLSCLSDRKSQTATAWYVKGSGSTKMYAEAGADSALLMVLPGSTEVKKYAESGSWTRITAHGQVGYVRTSSLTQEVPLVSAKSATVINPNGASYVNLRSSAKMIGLDNVLAHIRVNTKVEVWGKTRSWVKVNVDGKVGYVHKTFLSID